jgi:hypothetical protein
MSVDDVLAYYAEPGPLTTLTAPAVAAALLDGLPDDIRGIVDAVQSNLAHIFWLHVFDLEATETRNAQVQVRAAAEMLRQIHANDPAPLTTARPPAQRYTCNCRNFSTLTCALLRHKGIPARARCGFGLYFTGPDDQIKYCDHWVVEYWHAGESRWVQTDTQLDAAQRDILKIDFDPLDTPHDRFLNAGRAWQLCRVGGADPDTFGIFELHGWWFIAGNLVRDLAALNKVELMPWDGWGVMLDEAPVEEKFELLDRVAEMVLADNDRFDEMRAFYEENERLRVSPVITSWQGSEGPLQVVLADEPAIALA